ncbi:putative integral membrane protein (plasmid) [Streptantibioticus cattleyicolor NRRL 8057 = DSM 46488]|nr:putative integral membrane protein [Streptantibioticus cattleyicolor NRRL 8057 = DSM 46488]
MLGLIASFVITVDKLELLRDPHFRPACTINPVLSCTDVMVSAQASVFGFPNPLLGLAGYPVLVATGAALLGGARLGRWYCLALGAGTLLGAGFCMWLMSQALYAIGALCLWCCLVWAVTVVACCVSAHHIVRRGLLPTPRRLAIAVLEFPWAVPVVWCGTVVVLVGCRFWFYWRTLL